MTRITRERIFGYLFAAGLATLIVVTILVLWR